MAFLRYSGNMRKRHDKSSKMEGPSGPTVTDACAESESWRVSNDASRKKKLAALQNVSRTKSMGESSAKRPACIPHEIAGTTTIFPSQAKGESVLK